MRLSINARTKWIGVGAAALSITLAGVWIAGCGGSASRSSTAPSSASDPNQTVGGRLAGQAVIVGDSEAEQPSPGHAETAFFERPGGDIASPEELERYKRRLDLYKSKLDPNDLQETGDESAFVKYEDAPTSAGAEIVASERYEEVLAEGREYLRQNPEDEGVRWVMDLFQEEYAARGASSRGRARDQTKGTSFGLQDRRLESLERDKENLPEFVRELIPELREMQAREIAKRSRPSFVSAPGEELWVITKPAPDAAQPEPDPLAPTTGALVCRAPHRPDAPEGEALDQEMVPVPLRHTEVQAAIAGYIGSVSVTQEFHNPFSEKIEAVYVFPLPQNAAVDGFLMTIGDRTIRGIIRERQEAERIYAEARSRGHVASLLTQERPNIFTQKVANIEPGKRIDVEITYFHTLKYDGAGGGWWEWVFPMVVGPRYNPAGWHDPVLASPRGPANPNTPGTNVQYLRPEQRSGHDIGVQVEIDAGMTIEDIACRSHKIEVERDGATRARVHLSRYDTIPNKDFVLRYRVASDQVKTGVITHQDDQGGYFSLMLVPPAELANVQRQPVEMVFVLDCSGSMSGRPMEQSKNAMRRALKSMREGDTFQVIRFSNNASALGPNPVPATKDNIQRALRYVDKLSGSGGTQMIEGIRTALDFPHDPERLRFVVFLTDGFIGNESQILAAVHEKIGPARIFSFGVGSSPNRSLLDRMALLGRGVVGYLGLNDSASDVMDGFFERVSHPALTNVEIELLGMPSSAEVDVYPRVARDLFVGRPVIITGRAQGGLPETIRIHACMGADDFILDVPLDGPSGQENKALAALWARTKIADLMDEMAWTRDTSIKGEVESLALAYGLMSRFTAFVAVDSLTITEGAYGVTVAQPVPVPEGVRYDTTVR